MAGISIIPTFGWFIADESHIIIQLLLGQRLAVATRKCHFVNEASHSPSCKMFGYCIYIYIHVSISIAYHVYIYIHTYIYMYGRVCRVTSIFLYRLDTWSFPFFCTSIFCASHRDAPRDCRHGDEDLLHQLGGRAFGDSCRVNFSGRGMWDSEGDCLGDC